MALNETWKNMQFELSRQKNIPTDAEWNVYATEILELKSVIKNLTQENELLKIEARTSQMRLEAWVEDYYRMQNQQ